jgi:allantoin racemase
MGLNIRKLLRGSPRSDWGCSLKIRLVVPITGLSGHAIEKRLEFLREIAEPGTIVDAVQVVMGPPAIESEVDAVYAGHDILRLVKEAEDDGCDAVIIWCGSDPALSAARELVDIPVIGPGESMRAMASILGKKPCCIVPDIPVLEMRENFEKTDETIRSLVSLKLERDEGDVFFLGCLALWGFGRRLRETLGVPILDGAEVSIKMAEVMVKLGLHHSRIIYPKYPPEHREEQSR